MNILAPVFGSSLDVLPGALFMITTFIAVRLTSLSRSAKVGNWGFVDFKFVYELWNPEIISSESREF
jgi:hypothetical protein